MRERGIVTLQKVRKLKSREYLLQEVVSTAEKWETRLSQHGGHRNRELLCDKKEQWKRQKLVCSNTVLSIPFFIHVCVITSVLLFIWLQKLNCCSDKNYSHKLNAIQAWFQLHVSHSWITPTHNQCIYGLLWSISIENHIIIFTFSLLPTGHLWIWICNYT